MNKPAQPLKISLSPVKSSQISHIGHDPATNTLAVKFNRGDTEYHYPNVDEKAFNAFKGAESLGKYFGKHIKSLPFTKLAADKK
jgi:hypothetical protein